MDRKHQIIEKALEEIVSCHPKVGAIVQWRFGEEPGVCLGLGSRRGNPMNSRFPIYSIAKTVLAVCMLNLFDERKLNLDAPIASILTRNFPKWLAEVSTRQLLSHRSGLADYGSLHEYHEAVRLSPNRMTGREDIVSKVIEKGPQFEKGTSFLYSNVGYLFVREIIEVISGQTLQELFDRIIGEKLNIDMKFLSGSSVEIMSGYSPYLEKNAPDVRSYYDFWWVFHGTFQASVSDLTDLFLNLDKILSVKGLEEMTALHRLAFVHPEIHPSYGLGLMGDLSSRYGAFYGHNGGGPGFSVSTFVVPEKSVAVAAVVNRDSSLEAEKLVYRALDELLC